jgi:hypothetical protein
MIVIGGSVDQDQEGMDGFQEYPQVLIILIICLCIISCKLSLASTVLIFLLMCYNLLKYMYVPFQHKTEFFLFYLV